MATTVFQFANTASAAKTYLMAKETNGTLFTISKNSGDTIPSTATISKIAFSVTGTFPDTIDNPTGRSVAVYDSAGAQLVQSFTLPPLANPNISVTVSSAYFSQWLGATSKSIRFKQTSTASTSSALALIQKDTGTSSSVAFYVKFTITWAETATACGAPTSVSLSSALVESGPTITFSGATAGTGNTISGYSIHYSDSQDSITWGDWESYMGLSTTAAGMSTTVPCPLTRGTYRRVRVQTRGGAGSSYYSEWTTPVQFRYNQLPLPPTRLSAVQNGSGIVVEWSGQSDPDGNLSQLLLECEFGGDGNWFNAGMFSTESSTTYPLPNAKNGNQYRFRMWSADALGAMSATATMSDVVTMSFKPDAPTVLTPRGTTFNQYPLLLVRLGGGGDQTIHAPGWTASHAGMLAPNSRVVLQRDAPLSAAMDIVTIHTENASGAASDDVSVRIAYTPVAWTDMGITAGYTWMRAAHMNEIRAAVNAAGKYYDIAPVVWSEPIVAHTTYLIRWSAHVAEIRDAISSIAERINCWDAQATTPPIILPAWIDVTGQWPSADAMNQLRDTIQIL